MRVMEVDPLQRMELWKLGVYYKADQEAPSRPEVTMSKLGISSPLELHRETTQEQDQVAKQRTSQ